MPVILSQNSKVPKATTLPNVVSLVNKTGFKLASRLGYLIVTLDLVRLVRLPGGFVRMEWMSSSKVCSWFICLVNFNKMVWWWVSHLLLQILLKSINSQTMLWLPKSKFTINKNCNLNFCLIVCNKIDCFLVPVTKIVLHFDQFIHDRKMVRSTY